MTVDTKYKSGKSEGDENFPVASRIVAVRHRAPILAFYRFARAADDAADHPTLDPQSKLSILAALEETLLGRSDEASDAIALREQLRLRNLSAQHALDLLKAFRQDVTKHRYETWEDLMDYCRYSAMPVGRFVLDVHGESTATWGASDALCAALQIINHLQDCARDYQNLDRVYMPLNDLSAHGTTAAALGASQASPELLGCIRALAAKTEALMPDAKLLPSSVSDLRLAAETSVIVELARQLINLLKTRDPLSERVHLSKMRASWFAAKAIGATLAVRGIARFALSKSTGMMPHER
ncbi:squalene synthase HpnC [Hyphomicrobium sp.]|uniref:squalene synthase HpnC n=1 Tax=Hyphomicrobium sp. TaxID=82 RepID=UPI000F90D139|nr:squalene synthase HpnC [Hyphomicrobium sp.]RUO98896.1 MAG: squalene synthase HpnC [Hyphomicrobium sp.]